MPEPCGQCAKTRTLAAEINADRLRLYELLAETAGNVHGLRVNRLNRKDRKVLLRFIDDELEPYRPVKDWGMRG